jgi:hypothetical protein
MSGMTDLQSTYPPNHEIAFAQLDSFLDENLPQGECSASEFITSTRSRALNTNERI